MSFAPCVLPNSLSNCWQTLTGHRMSFLLLSSLLLSSSLLYNTLLLCTTGVITSLSLSLHPVCRCCASSRANKHFMHACECVGECCADEKYVVVVFLSVDCWKMFLCSSLRRTPMFLLPQTCLSDLPVGEDLLASGCSPRAARLPPMFVRKNDTRCLMSLSGG